MQHTSTGRGQSWLTSPASVPDNHAQPLGLTDVSVSKAMMMEIKMRSISDVNLWASHVAKQLQKQKDTADARFSKLKLCPRLYHIMFYHVPVSRNFDVLIDIACLDLHLSGLELLGLRSTTWRRQGTCFLWCHSKWTCSEHVSCWEERITATLMQDSDHVSCIQLWIGMQKKSWPPFCMFKLRKIESACTFSAFSWIGHEQLIEVFASHKSPGCWIFFYFWYSKVSQSQLFSQQKLWTFTPPTHHNWISKPMVPLYLRNTTHL